MKNLLKTTVMIMVLISSILLASSKVSASDQLVNITIDGKLQVFEQPAVMIDNSTMVPMRAIFETLGAEIRWDQTTKTVTATRGSTTIKLTVGKQIAYVNGNPKTMSTGPQLVNNNTMIPLRFVSEALGGRVDWDASSMTAAITSINQLAQIPTTSDPKYLDKESYTNPKKYTKDQIGVNEMLGFDFSQAITDLIIDRYRDAVKAQAEEDYRIQEDTDKLMRVLDKESLIIDEIKAVWKNFNTQAQMDVWENLEYEYKLILWDTLKLIDRVGLWKYVDVREQAKFFDWLTDEQKMDVWNLSTNNLEKRFIWLQLRFIDESKPNEFWRKLHPNEQVRFYKDLNDSAKKWLTDHLTSEEAANLLELLKKTEVRSTEAVG